MIRVKGFGLARGFMGEGYTEVDHDADRIRITMLAGESTGQTLLELLKNEQVCAAYAPGRWVSAHVVEGARAVKDEPRIVNFTKEGE